MVDRSLQLQCRCSTSIHESISIPRRHARRDPSIAVEVAQSTSLPESSSSYCSDALSLLSPKAKHRRRRLDPVVPAASDTVAQSNDIPSLSSIDSPYLLSPPPKSPSPPNPSTTARRPWTAPTPPRAPQDYIGLSTATSSSCCSSSPNPGGPPPLP